MTTLHLIRHGQTDWNAERRCQGQSESELDDTGKRQAEERRPHIEQLGITAIYSSSSVRTRQTTQILAKNLSLNVTYLDSLREIFLGSWESRLWDDIKQSDPDRAQAFLEFPHTFSKPDAESYFELRDRGVAALENIIDAEEGGEILVVSHGALLKAAMTHYAPVDLSRIRDVPGLANCSHSVVTSGAQSDRTLHSIAGVALVDTAWSSQNASGN